MNTSLHRFFSRTLASSALIVAFAFPSSPVAAQGMFHDWTLAGGWPTGQMYARVDWSSDLGPDWIYSSSASSDAVVWSGQGSNWSTSPYTPSITNNTVGWEVSRPGGAAGITYSGGEVTVGSALTLENGAVAKIHFHLWSVLGENSAGYGIDTSALTAGHPFVSTGSQPYAPLHWRLDWDTQTSGNADLRSTLYFYGTWREIGGTDGSASGVFGTASYPWYSEGNFMTPDLLLSTYAGDASGDPRSGRIDTWVTLSLSRDPIQDVAPIPTDGSAVPEPSTYGLIGAAIVAGLAVRRKLRATPTKKN
ncbi:MAG: PEP-CTERM sorting domain-containing protein [Nibricoccus sp.]